MTRRTSPGRPPTIHARRVTVSLDDETLDRLREIGDGNVSGAIRWLTRQQAARPPKKRTP